MIVKDGIEGRKETRSLRGLGEAGFETWTRRTLGGQPLKDRGGKRGSQGNKKSKPKENSPGSKTWGNPKTPGHQGKHCSIGGEDCKGGGGGGEGGMRTR